MTQTTETVPSITAKIDETITEFINESIAQAATIDKSYEELWRNIDKLIRAGGKRLRPYLTVLAYEAFGGIDTDRMLPIAAAQELLHVSLLIHDDIIDRDYIRHGSPNIAGLYDEIYKATVDDTTSRSHYANSAAILAGDLMLSGAYQIVINSDVTSQEKIIAQRLIAHAIFEVGGGELLDTESAFRPIETDRALLITRYKTSGYSFTTPLLTGAKLAEASPSQCALLEEFALAIGVAFQLTDDILGVFGSELKTGKSTTTDITEGRKTFMIERCLRLMSDDDRQIFEQTFGNQDASPSSIETIKQIIEKSGARHETEAAIASYTEKAHNILSRLDVSSEHYLAFENFIKRMTQRSA